MRVPISEILDRLSIVKLKVERIGEPQLQDEFLALSKALEDYKKEGFNIKENWLEDLYDINRQIWDLESDIRRGKEKELGLEEVGRRAILIRDTNKQRVAIKNKIAEETGSGFKDVKMNHGSA